MRIRARLLLGVAALVAWLAFLAAGMDARGHDSAAWIDKGKYRGPQGSLCCGEVDCFVQARVIYSKEHHAWVIHDPLTGVPVEAVPVAETLPSEDHQFWRCQFSDGSRRCFFAPQPSM